MSDQEADNPYEVGDYRVEYDIDDEDRRVEVVRVAHRADIYGIT